MESQNAIGRKVLTIKCECLQRKQVYRHSVAGKGIENQHIEGSGVLAADGEAGVAKHHICMRRSFPEISEELASDALYQRIDFIEAKIISGLTVSRQGS